MRVGPDDRSAHPAGSRPFPWEASYPPGVVWDVPIALMTLPELLDRAAQAWGPRPALSYRGVQVSYRAFAAAVHRLASGIAALDLPRAAPLALFLPNTGYHPLLFFAALRAGLRIAHLSPLDAEREVVAKLADCGARVVATVDSGALRARAERLVAEGRIDRLILAEEADWPGLVQRASVLVEGDQTAASVAGLAGHSGAARITVGELVAMGAATPPEAPKVQVEDIALLQFTGGTTGRAKAAVLSHGNLSAAVAMGNAWARPQGLVRPGDGRIICALPLFHIYALTSVLLRGLSNGAEIVIMPRFDASAVLGEIEQRRATAFAGVPTMWIALLAEPGVADRDYSSLVTIASGGAPLPLEIQQQVERVFGRPLLGGWGMTETGPAGTQVPRGRPDKRGTIGLPMPGIEMAIVALDDPARRLGPGETGEIIIRGANVTRGYWARPEESRAAVCEGWLLTGDVGTMDAEGFFFLVDRKKDMIISGGFNVYPRMIEDAIYEHPAIREVIVIGVPDGYRGEAAKAFVSIRGGCEAPTLDELREFLTSRLGRHELPAALEVRDALPRTSVGKLSKKDLIAELRRGGAG